MVAALRPVAFESSLREIERWWQSFPSTSARCLRWSRGGDFFIGAIYTSRPDGFPAIFFQKAAIRAPGVRGRSLLESNPPRLPRVLGELRLQEFDSIGAQDERC